ncbi:MULTISPECIES: UDP-N-acetylmuramate dehydrogenase [Bacillaceae]|uniref:UDP-N-acetylmuramate dehydrogenase n=1 Tax=Bacillaceae TaxID=186817 RepID=UPI001E647826|nr:MULTISPECIES: UDP-N-acetylmuramate dehydrogenase [Bacillaceae]MCE4050626.1 UDP-N-acetylmuramate dehydrogenase [Bacillus sp. Au-Bac7]MCM3031974.1 UDP-N-acetylmuramate dehydrogenase [Niallia sp. MER 6]MDL0436021.1 UDP-N-acetylmuramate dehydrogenase [Niallia sp. SS-2023]UPO87887.1 UDP-N-acetylmuramate dehydrogenase [Niallia sp. Man26]
MKNYDVKEKFLQIMTEDEVKIDEPLSQYTYTKIGGKADYLLFPTTFEQLQNAYKVALEAGIPITILGNGSNVLIKDGGIRGVVFNLTKLVTIRLEGDKVFAESGAALIDTSRFALEHSLTGLEFACGIPGSIGGALYMNAGAYGGEIADVLESATVLTSAGEIISVRKEDLDLGYRTSNIAKNHYVVLEAVFKLQPGKQEEIKAKMDELTFLRESKQPLEYPSCGSVFKRPPGYFAGKLIQDSNLQGTKIGGAQVSTKHAGFIVNVDNATADDYISLIKHVQKTVKENYDVNLETEVRIIGEDK